MVEGDKWEMYIPSELGYGEQGSPPKIAGGDVLVFVMEIIKIEGKKIPAVKTVVDSAFGKKEGGSSTLIDFSSAEKGKDEVSAEDSIHFVFTTDCRAYQNWQSEVLAFSFELIQQRGKLTRVLSGCNSTEKLQAVRRYFHQCTYKV